MADDRWRQSTEGDLDPDLAEESEYSAWEPPRRRGLQLAYRVLLVAVLVAIVGGALLSVRW